MYKNVYKNCKIIILSIMLRIKFDYNYCKYTRFKLLYIDRVQRNISSSNDDYNLLFTVYTL